MRANSIDGALHAQADAEERDPVLAGEADRLDLAVDAALAEAAGHQHAVDPGERLARPLRARSPPPRSADDPHPRVVGDAGVVERLVDRLVGVVVLDVLADDGDRDFVSRVA